MAQITEVPEEPPPLEGREPPEEIIAQLHIQETEEVWINVKTNVSTSLASEVNLKKEEKTLEEMLPSELLDFKDVFHKTSAERFPES